MLQTRKRRAALRDSREEDRHDQLSDVDMELETFTKLFKSRSSVQEQTSPRMEQTQVIVNSGAHLIKKTSSHKKKKRKFDLVANDSNKIDGKSYDSVDTNPRILTSAKKAKKMKSSSDSVVQSTGNVQHTKSKKPCSAAVKNSGRKRKKQKMDPDGSKLKSDVLSLESESDSVAEKNANASDSAEMPSSSLSHDLECIEDSIDDDYVSEFKELEVLI